MDFRTEIQPVKEKVSIDYKTPLVFIGSCFASEIGKYLKEAKFDTVINPFGVLYNPASISDAINILIQKKEFKESDLYTYQGRYLSFSHDTSFSSDNIKDALTGINNAIYNASEKLKKASFLFVTFGTARVYNLKESNKIVSNCHKLPARHFERELLGVDDIVENWTALISDLNNYNPGLKLVFTVSPVRHWKDGAHGNQLSKSILLLAIDKLVNRNSQLSYFPSYELMMDELRDYRFYKSDMLHPSDQAVEFIWDFFCSTWFTEETLTQYKKVAKIITAAKHRLISEDKDSLETFKKSMLKKIEEFSSRYKSPDLSSEHDYFSSL